MSPQKLNNSNEKSELKTFIDNMRSGSLIKLIESNKVQFEEKCNYLTQKLKKFDEEMQRKLIILQQNSHLIEKFQNKLQELSDQNIKLIDQEHILREENENLHAQLQYSEDKFAQLDILYDQKLTDMSDRSNEVMQQMLELKSCDKQRLDQFDQTQTDLKEMLARSEQRNVELMNELNDMELEKKADNEELTNKLSELNNILNQKTIDYEERIQDLQTRVSMAYEGNKELNELKNELANINNMRTEDQQAFNIEKSRVIAENENLEVVVEDVKKRLISKDKIIEDMKRKLTTKEKEVEELYFKFKQITRSTKSINTSQTGTISNLSGKFSSKRNPSPDDPKPLDDSSDSESSSEVSCYKGGRKRLIMANDGNADLFDNLKLSRPQNQQHQFRVPGFGFNKKMRKISDDIEIPESPIVSSSAFGNNDRK